MVSFWAKVKNNNFHFKIAFKADLTYSPQLLSQSISFLSLDLYLVKQLMAFQ